jgi:hypothetical protein
VCGRSGAENWASAIDSANCMTSSGQAVLTIVA